MITTSGAAVRKSKVKGPAAERWTGLFLDPDSAEISLLLKGRGLCIGPVASHDLAVFGLTLLRQAMAMDAARGDAVAAAAARQVDAITAAFRPESRH